MILVCSVLLDVLIVCNKVVFIFCLQGTITGLSSAAPSHTSGLQLAQAIQNIVSNSATVNHDAQANTPGMIRPFNVSQPPQSAFNPNMPPPGFAGMIASMNMTRMSQAGPRPLMLPPQHMPLPPPGGDTAKGQPESDRWSPTQPERIDGASGGRRSVDDADDRRNHREDDHRFPDRKSSSDRERESLLEMEEEGAVEDRPVEVAGHHAWSVHSCQQCPMIQGRQVQVVWDHSASMVQCLEDQRI